MSSIVNPTFDAGTWYTEQALNIDKVFEQLYDPNQVAMPTLRLLWANMKETELGPEEKFGWNLITKVYSPGVASANQRFEGRDIDNITRMEFTPCKMENNCGANDVEMAHMSNDLARMNHIDIKVASMHKGTTETLNYLLFSDWNETIDDGYIDIETELSVRRCRLLTFSFVTLTVTPTGSQVSP